MASARLGLLHTPTALGSESLSIIQADASLRVPTPTPTPAITAPVDPKEVTTQPAPEAAERAPATQATGVANSSNEQTPALPPTPPPEPSDGSEAFVHGRHELKGACADGFMIHDMKDPHPHGRARYSRRLGDSELSYYLPSRADGVNDMYLHLGLRAKPAHAARIFEKRRVETVWALLRLKHPLLASAVEMTPGDYDDVRFVYTPPKSVEWALKDAEDNLKRSQDSKDELIGNYLNGPRTLSNTRLSYLIISRSGDAIDPNGSGIITPPRTPSISRSQTPPGLADSQGQHHAPVVSTDLREAVDTRDEEVLEHVDILICAAHFIGDGMALHTFANDFFTLLAGPQDQKERTDQEIQPNSSWRSGEQLMILLQREWTLKFGTAARIVEEPPNVLPSPLEDGLPARQSPLRHAMRLVDFQISQEKFVGGQSFPKAPTKLPRHTVVPTVSFTEGQTKAILKKCKANGVTIANALFALCNFAWARIVDEDREMKKLPTMMYSALNLRPNLSKELANQSYWFLSVGYFNIVLPSFLPSRTSLGASDLERVFWHRARLAKEQGVRCVKNPMVNARSLQMARERGQRARMWGKQDDDAALRKSGVLLAPVASTSAPAPPVQSSQLTLGGRVKNPSNALIGLSLLGNLDGIYQHSSYPDLTLHTLTTGSRQRQGGMLLFGYTFSGKLWLSLGWDKNGFDVPTVNRFWQTLLLGVDEFLV